MLRYRIEASISPYRAEGRTFRTGSWKRARTWQKLWCDRHPFAETFIVDEQPYRPMPRAQQRAKRYESAAAYINARA